MRMHGYWKFISILTFLSLALAVAQYASRGNVSAQSCTQSKPYVVATEQSDLYLRCVQLGKRADGDITDMVPHRTWTWQLDFEKSRQQLDQFRRDLNELNEAEGLFVASLDSRQRAKVQHQLDSLQELWRHLEDDAQSLDLELRNGYPTRWHVSRDSLDMQKEIRRWNKLYGQVAAKLKL